MTIRHLLDMADLPPVEVAAILDAADDPQQLPAVAPVVGLLFLTSSLRTRLGFAAAAARASATPILIEELRWGPEMSQAEGFSDTLRTAAGMVNVLVTRTPFALDRQQIRATLPVPLVNGGDAVEHPTQALIDLQALRRFGGAVEDMHLLICGDLTMRACRSLLHLLASHPPARLTLVAPRSRRQHGVDLGELLRRRTHQADVLGDVLGDADVLYLPGLPAGGDGDRLDDAARASFVLTADAAALLREDAVVLSPLPVIDEITDDVRDDPRIRMFEQSDLGVGVRQAVLSWVMTVA
jgi:aspartate carbamoyltransferase catalytic subunit